MPALEDHTGLLAQTIPYYNRRSFVNISNKKTHYTAFPAIVRNARKAINSKWTKFQFGLPVEAKDYGGTEFKWNMQVTSNNNGEWVSEDDPINITKRDHQIQAALPWRLARVQDWSYSKWELSACKGKEELVSLLTSRTLGADQGAADWFEDWFWGTPPASTNDKTAFPLRYWIFSAPESSLGSTVYTGYTAISTTVTNGNLLALNHNSYSSGPAGVSRATYREAGNWYCQYTTFNDADCIYKITNALLDTDWHSPVDFPDMTKAGPDKAMYTTKANYIIRARLARQQNDANTSDLVARISDLDVFRVPMYRVPQFDSTDFALDASSNKDVIYGLDWNTIWWASKTGFRMEDQIFGPSREAPHTYTHVRFLGGQLVCTEARRNFVLSK